MDWARILAFVTGMVDQELLARIEYLAAENRILKAQLKGRLKLSDAERATLAPCCRRAHRVRLPCGARRWIEQHAHALDPRSNLDQQLRPLGGDLVEQQGDSAQVAR